MNGGVTTTMDSNTNSPTRLSRLQEVPHNISNGAGGIMELVMDELTEYAMAKEGIELKDIELR